MAGDDWQKFANLRAYYGFMWGYPGKKLLFMGQEFAQRARVERGSARSTGTCCDAPPHEGMRKLVRDLNRALPRHARRCTRAIASREGFEWLIADDRANSVFAWLRKAPGAQPGRRDQQLHAGAARRLPRAAAAATARWREILNTDAGIYGGSGQGQSGRRRRRKGGDGAHVTLPPLATIMFEFGHSANSLGGKTWNNNANQPLARDAMAYVLAGGRGSRLKELTDRRAKPAVYFGGKTRIIDFALSNALNSGIRRIGVATQYKAHSLIRHLQRGWNFLRPERNESFDILPASQRVSESAVVRGHGRCGATRTSTSSRATASSTWSSWPATTSTRWTTS